MCFYIDNEKGLLCYITEKYGGKINCLDTSRYTSMGSKTILFEKIESQ